MEGLSSRGTLLDGLLKKGQQTRHSSRAESQEAIQ